MNSSKLPTERVTFNLKTFEFHGYSSKIIGLEQKFIALATSQKVSYQLVKLSEFNFPELVTCLLNLNYGVDPVDSRGFSALIISIMQGHTEVAKMLLHGGARHDLLQEETLVSPLMCCAYYDNTEIAKMLIDRGAQIDS